MKEILFMLMDSMKMSFEKEISENQNLHFTYAVELAKSKNIDFEWHYIKVDDLTWKKNIAERNEKINKGQNKTDFFVTEGLKNKLLDLWEEPKKEEIDVWYELKR